MLTSSRPPAISRSAPPPSPTTACSCSRVLPVKAFPPSPGTAERNFCRFWMNLFWIYWNIWADIASNSPGLFCWQPDAPACDDHRITMQSPTGPILWSSEWKKHSEFIHTRRISIIIAEKNGFVWGARSESGVFWKQQKKKPLNLKFQLLYSASNLSMEQFD